jgi:hypothetical protein
MILATLGQIWDYFLFDRWGYPMHSVGFIMLILAILLITIGFPLWTIVNFGSLRGWQQPITILWVLNMFEIWFLLFAEKEYWLIPRFGIDGVFLADADQSIAYVLRVIIL